MKKQVKIGLFWAGVMSSWTERNGDITASQVDKFLKQYGNLILSLLTICTPLKMTKCKVFEL